MLMIFHNANEVCTGMLPFYGGSVFFGTNVGQPLLLLGLHPWWCVSFLPKVSTGRIFPLFWLLPTHGSSHSKNSCSSLPVSIQLLYLACLEKHLLYQRNAPSWSGKLHLIFASTSTMLTAIV